MNLQGLRRHGRLGVVLPVLLAILWGTPAAAFQFEFGEVDGSLDSTISYGMSWRVSDRDKDIVGTANGGTAYSVNGDDGNLNFDDGDTYSLIFKGVHDLELKKGNWGLFLRGKYWYDQELENGKRPHGNLLNASDLARSLGVSSIVMRSFSEWGAALSTMIVAIVALNQIIGPIAFKFALGRVGEARASPDLRNR